MLDEPRRPAARARKRAPARKAAAKKGRARKSAREESARAEKGGETDGRKEDGAQGSGTESSGTESSGTESSGAEAGREAIAAGTAAGEAMTEATKYFEDFQIGETFSIPSKTVTDAHFLFFSGLTGDNNPIHYDEEFAKGTRFGKRVTHGLLLASMTAAGASTLNPLIEGSIVAFLEQSSRFLKPVLIGRHDYAGARGERTGPEDRHGVGASDEPDHQPPRRTLPGGHARLSDSGSGRASGPQAPVR